MAITQITNRSLGVNVARDNLGASSNMATFISSASASDLRSAMGVSNTTGTGVLVFGTSPTIVTPTIAQINGSAAVTLTIVNSVLASEGVLSIRNTNNTQNTTIALRNAANGVVGYVGAGNTQTSTFPSTVYMQGGLGIGLVLATDSTERLRILSGGNVGIGTITPNERLTVSGNLSATGTIVANNYNPASNVSAFLAAPTSANLAAAVTDETGTNSLVFNTNPTLSGATVSGALTINATSFSFGLSSRENFLTKLSNRFVYKNEVIPYAEIFDDFPTTVDSRFGTHRWISNSGTVAYYTAGGPTIANYWGAISLTTGAVLGNSANIYLGPSAGSNGQTASRFNLSFQTCFCLSATSCEYRQALNGGGATYTIAVIADTGVIQLESTNIGGAGINSVTVSSGLSLSAGNFVSGTRYRLFFKPLSLTQCEVYFASAPWNSSTWTTLVDTTVTHASVANAAVCSQPFVTVTTKLSSAVAAYLDWVSIRQEIQR